MFDFNSDEVVDQTMTSMDRVDNFYGYLSGEIPACSDQTVNPFAFLAFRLKLHVKMSNHGFECVRRGAVALAAGAGPCSNGLALKSLHLVH
jgi:hypothetical protein